MLIKIFLSLYITLFSYFAMCFSLLVMSWERRGSVDVEALNSGYFGIVAIWLVMLFAAVLLIWRNKFWWGIGISLLMLPAIYFIGSVMIEILKTGINYLN